jgi:hypothetical protein
MPASGSRQAAQPTLPPVRISMPQSQAEQIVKHSHDAWTTIAPFSGRDAAGRPFSIDVGSRAVAVYCEGA